MITTSSRRLARTADDAAAAAVLGASSIHGDAVLQSAAFDAAIHADDAAVLALTAVAGAEPGAIELHVRRAQAHAESVRALALRAAG